MTLYRPRKGTSRRSKTTYADLLFSRLIRERDKACRKCGSEGPLECAHIFGRRYRTVRWDPVNALALCRTCHLDFDTDRAGNAVWLVSAVGPEEYRALALRRLEVWDKNLDGVIERLKAAA